MSSINQSSKQVQYLSSSQKENIESSLKNVLNDTNSNVLITLDDCKLYFNSIYKSFTNYFKNFIFLVYYDPQKEKFSDENLNLIMDSIQNANKNQDFILKTYEMNIKTFTNYSSRRYKKFIENILISFEKELCNSLFNYAFSLFITNILDFQIYQWDRRLITFTFIRSLSDISLCDKLIFNINTEMKLFLNKKLECIFPDSNRLLFNVSIEELFFNALKINFSEVLRTNSSKNNELLFFADEENRIIQFQKDLSQFYYFQRDKKSSGINDGFVLNIYSSSSSVFDKATLFNSFYIKKYHQGSLNTKNCDSRSTSDKTGKVSISRSFILSSSSKNIRPSTSCHFLNLKEPLTYSILNALSLGPEVSFVINPYSSHGFYIATKNLNIHGKLFTVINNLETESPENQVQTAFCKKIKELKSNYSEMSIGLIELDIFSTIFMLKDLNTNNYGILFDNQEEFDLQVTKMKKPIGSRQFKIIDFTYPIPGDKTYYNEAYSFKDPDFVDQFIDSKECKSSLKYNPNLSFTFDLLFSISNRIQFFHNAFEQLNERILNFKLESCQQLKNKDYKVHESDESDDEIEKKLQFILDSFNQNIKDLLLRKRGDKPEEDMLKHPITNQPRTNAELIGFTLSEIDKSIDEYANNEKNLQIAFDDLDNYCQDIMCNYKAFRNYLSRFCQTSASPYSAITFLYRFINLNCSNFVQASR